MAPKGSSVVWDHFIDKGQYRAQCKICRTEFNYKSSVSNLTKHLKRKHPLLNLVPRNAKCRKIFSARFSKSRQKPLGNRSFLYV